jgi:hypothetical protein
MALLHFRREMMPGQEEREEREEREKEEEREEREEHEKHEEGLVLEEPGYGHGV